MDEPVEKKLLKGEFLMGKNTYRLDIRVDAEDPTFSIPLLEWYALHQAPYTEGRRILWLIEQCRKNEENAGRWLLHVEKMKEIEAIAAWQEYSDEVKMREDQEFVISTIERIKQELIKRNEALDELEENKDEK